MRMLLQLPRLCRLQATYLSQIIIRQGSSLAGFESEEALLAHKESMKTFNKASFDYEYLFGLKKSQLVYKVIRLQRQLDSYTIMKSVTNVDGRDKLRVDHPDIEDVIDHRDFNLRRVAFKVAYLGWDYMAYAWSENTDRKVKGHTNIIERVFLEALLRQQLVQGIGKRVNIDRCGRTDAKVSGLSQVICANVRSNLDEGFGIWKRKTREEIEALNRERENNSAQDLNNIEDPREKEQAPVEEKNNETVEESHHDITDRSLDHKEIPYVKLLNEALPPDIRVLAWSPVNRRFSPRRGCTSRTYRYFLPRGGLNIELMKEAAQKLVGTHDFRNFAKLSSDNLYRVTERSITDFDIEVLDSRADPNLPEFDICTVTITSRGFLYRQVRFMLAVLCQIGQGKEDMSIIDQLLDVETMRGRPSYRSMAATPLLLYDCQYDENEINWRWDKDSLQTTAAVMSEIWAENATKSEITRAIYEHAVQKLDSESRSDIKGAVFMNLLPHSGASGVGGIKTMERSRDEKEFVVSERRRTVRRLQRKGRYWEASDVHAGNKDTWVGWKS